MNISEQFQQIGIRFYQNSLVTSSEERAVTVVRPIEALSIYTIQMPHEPRKIGIRGLDQKMVMIRQQAERCNADIPHGGALLQELYEAEIIIPIWEDRFAASTPIHDMVPCVRIFNA